MQDIKNISIRLIEKPERKVSIKRGVKATEYWSYCNELGCEVWEMLTGMPSIVGEPVCLWLPPKFVLPNTSRYVQGAEVPFDYHEAIPVGFDVIELPAAKYLLFQGEPFAEEDYAVAIEQVQSAIAKYDPATIGYQLDTDNPRIQLEPKGTRGYIELLPIKSAAVDRHQPLVNP